MRRDKFIFLDIDGVLNNNDDSDLHRCAFDNEGYFFSPACVRRLNHIIQKTGAKIVVSSIWREGIDEIHMAEILRFMGVKGTMAGCTPQLRRGPYAGSIYRGNEVYAWLQDYCNEHGLSKHQFKDYVILDDDSDFLIWQQPNFVHVNGQHGLTDWYAEKAIKILNKGRHAKH